MLKAIELENFKAFGERSRIEFAPITLIFGENSVGKSSILQSLNLLKQSRESRDKGALILPRTDGGIVDLGGFREMVFDHDLSRNVAIRVDFAEPMRSRQQNEVAAGGRANDYVGFEVAFKRPTEVQEVQLESLTLHSSDVAESVATFKPLELDIAERQRLARDSMSLRDPRSNRVADVTAAKCSSLTNEPTFWYEIFERTKRRADKISGELRQLQAEGQEAAHTQDGRIFVEDSRIRKALKNICDPLELGSMGETHFVLEGFWKTLFNKALSASEKENPDVADMKSWMGDDRGLPREIENLLIMVYAEQTNRAFVRFGGNFIPKLDDLPGELELRQEVLPSEDEWQETRKRIADLFGDDLSRLLNASNLASLGEKFSDNGGYIAKFKADCDALPNRLQLILHKLGVSEDEASECDRVKTAKAARAFFDAVEGQEPTPLVKAIAAARIETSGKALGRSIKSAATVLASLLEPNRWELFEAVAEINDRRKTDATLLIADLRDSLMMDEFALAGGLPAKLSDALGRAIELVRTTPIVTPPIDDDVEIKLPPTRPGWKRLDSGSTERMSGSDLTALTEKLAGKLEDNPKRRVTVQWTIEEQSE